MIFAGLKMPTSCGLAGMLVKVVPAGACTETLRYWGHAERIDARFKGGVCRADGNARAVRKPFSGQVASLGIHAEPLRSDVDEGRRLGSAARAALRDPRGGYPVQLPAGLAQVSRRGRSRPGRSGRRGSRHDWVSFAREVFS